MFFKSNVLNIKGHLLLSNFFQVPINLRQSYVDAYQCFIWNKIVSKRIAKFGSKVIVGDLVFPKGNNGQHNQREVIFIDDGNIRKYKIYDVVLPLPGPDTIYPANEIAGWYIDLFREDGLSEKDFDQTSKYRIFVCPHSLIFINFILNELHNFRIYGLDGVYRFMIIRPSDFKWEFVRYEYNPQKLISSDSKQLVRQPPVGVLGMSSS
jgi:tRNA pseudouridine13 synthase